MEAADERAKSVLESVGVKAGCEPADFGGGHPFVERWPLGQVADASPDCEAFAAAIKSEHAHFALCCLSEAEHEPDRSRLARAVFAEQREHDAGWNFQRNVR